jgi:signal peptidase I
MTATPTGGPSETDDPPGSATAHGESGTEPDAGTVADTDADAEGTHDHRKQRSFWRELPILVVVALTLAYLIKTFLVQAFFIPSESMEETLLVGDRVLVNKLAYRFGEIERGDVVVFDGRGTFEREREQRSNAGNAVGDALKRVASAFGLAPGTESDYIKRVIGIGGDHVVCCDDDGRITVNGTPIEEEGYLFPGDAASVTPFDITVPEDRVWLMGDHRSRSEDSRAHTGSPGGGTVSVDRVLGRAFVVVWPIGRWDTLSRPDTFDAVPDAEPAG